MRNYTLIAALCICCAVVAQGLMAPSEAPMMAPMASPMMSGSNMMYNVSLLPQNQVPGVSNEGAMGYSVLKFSPDTNMVQYKIVVSNLYGPVAAHIHAGNMTSNGPVVAFLYNATGPMNDATATSGTLSSGSLMPANFIGPAKGLSVSDFVSQYLSNGDSYVNVHSMHYPDGVIRGQIDSKAMSMYMPAADMAMAPMSMDMSMPMAPSMMMPMPMAPMAIDMPMAPMMAPMSMDMSMPMAPMAIDMPMAPMMAPMSMDMPMTPMSMDMAMAPTSMPVSAGRRMLKA